MYPYLNIYFQQNGLSTAQIGFLALLRPWINAPMSFAWAALADACSAHRPIFIATLVTSTIVGCSAVFFHSFPAFAVLSVVWTVLGSPVGVLADAAVVRRCQEVRGLRGRAKEGVEG